MARECLATTGDGSRRIAPRPLIEEALTAKAVIGIRESLLCRELSAGFSEGKLG
jgi:hypothetical protein